MGSFQVAGAWFGRESARLEKLVRERTSRITRTHLDCSAGRKVTFCGPGAWTVAQSHDRPLETTDTHA